VWKGVHAALLDPRLCDLPLQKEKTRVSSLGNSLCPHCGLAEGMVTSLRSSCAIMKVIPLKPRVLFILRHPRVRNLLYVVSCSFFFFSSLQGPQPQPPVPSLQSCVFFCFFCFFFFSSLPYRDHTHTPNINTTNTHNKHKSSFQNVSAP
jgi:hypothetical protein